LSFLSLPPVSSSFTKITITREVPSGIRIFFDHKKEDIRGYSLATEISPIWFSFCPEIAFKVSKQNLPESVFLSLQLFVRSLDRWRSQHAIS
jgi:hypothetical protein